MAAVVMAEDRGPRRRTDKEAVRYSSGSHGGEGDGSTAAVAAGWLYPSAKLWSEDSCGPTTTSKRQRQRPCSGSQRPAQAVYVIKWFSMSVLAFSSCSAAPVQLLGPFSAPYRASTDQMMCGDATVHRARAGQRLAVKRPGLLLLQSVCRLAWQGEGPMP